MRDNKLATFKSDGAGLNELVKLVVASAPCNDITLPIIEKVIWDTRTLWIWNYFEKSELSQNQIVLFFEDFASLIVEDHYFPTVPRVPEHKDYFEKITSLSSRLHRLLDRNKDLAENTSATVFFGTSIPSANAALFEQLFYRDCNIGLALGRIKAELSLLNEWGIKNFQTLDTYSLNRVRFNGKNTIPSGRKIPFIRWLDYSFRKLFGCKPKLLVPMIRTVVATVFDLDEDDALESSIKKQLTIKSKLKVQSIGNRTPTKAKNH